MDRTADDLAPTSAGSIGSRMAKWPPYLWPSSCCRMNKEPCIAVEKHPSGKALPPEFAPALVFTYFSVSYEDEEVVISSKP